MLLLIIIKKKIIVQLPVENEQTKYAELNIL